MNIKIKLIIAFILGGIICSVISVSATLMYQANQVKYTKSNNEEVTLDSALNELYGAANAQTYTVSGDITPGDNDIVLPTNGKKLTSDITIKKVSSPYYKLESTNATEANILKNKTAYSGDGTKLTGSIETYSGSTSVKSTSTSQTLSTKGKYMNSDITVEANDVLTFSILADTYSTYNGIADFVLPQANKYKYFKVTSVTKDTSSSISSCTLKGWSVTKSTSVALNTNQQYNVRSTTDGLNLTDAILTAKGTTNGQFGRCAMNINFYN